MTIRLAIPGDIPTLIALDRRCPGASHWSEEQYQQAFATDTSRLVLVAVRPSADQRDPIETVGFLVARHLAPEWELENIAVAPEARRSGLGMQLLNALLVGAKETNSEAVFLEVRESNAAARALYENAGFRQTGRRTTYYADPAEDAILYTYALAGTLAISV